MMKFFTQKSILLFVVLLLHISTTNAQWFRSYYSAYTLVAPEKRLEGTKQIAVMNFETKTSYSDKEAGNDMGTRIGDYIVGNLLQEYRGAQKDKIYIDGIRTNIYDLVERSKLEQVLKEQRISVSGLIDDTQAVEVGKILGIDAIVVGSVSFSYKDERTKEEKRTKEGKVYYQYSLKRTVDEEARMKILDVKTARILGTLTPRRTVVDIKTSDKYVEDGAVKSVIVMADEAAREIAYELTDYFAPRFEKLSFPIENIKLKEFKDRSKEGRDYLIRGELGKGFQIFKAIYDADSYNPKAAYNVGTVYEVVGDFENAYACYSVAHELEADDTDFFKAFQRAEKGKLLVTDLKAIGIEIKPRMFQNGTSDVLLSKVETKGGKSDRVQIYEEPNDKSVVIAKIPGGIKLAVVQKAEGWYLVKILGGKEGYVRENEVSEE